MKKIGMTTYFTGSNYGSKLQATAISRYFRDRGFDAFFVERFRVWSFMLRHPRMIYARIYNKLNTRNNRAFFSPVPYAVSEARKARIAQYERDNYRWEAITSAEQWRDMIREGTAFMTGSDIVWQPANGYPAFYFTDYAHYAGLRRFSFGTSIGARELPRKYHRAYRRYLGSMKQVGVREEYAAKLLRDITGREIEKVLDPTMLLTAGEWDAYAEKARLSVDVDPRGYVLCYFVMHDERYWEYVRKVKEACGLQVIVLPMHALDESQPYDVVMDGTPYEFIWLIKHAAFICTDSFHACVFSTIYHKEFYLLRRARKAEDDKYDDFLNRYALTDRVVTDEGRFTRNERISFETADRQMAEDRERSLAFLDRALSD